MFSVWIGVALLAGIFIAVSAQGEMHPNFGGVIQRMRPTISPNIQAQAAMEVIARIAPDNKNSFVVNIDNTLRGLSQGKDVFILEKSSKDNVVKITATSGVAATWAFNHYLKYYCNSHVSWEASNINIPSPLPDVNITIIANDWVRYYQNVCTTSYSFVWWNWAQWEKHIDWMALNGINLALAFNGQEAIWERVYKRLTMTQAEMDAHFSGPAFLSWLRMANLRAFGGPLSENWHNRSIILQKQIVKQMRNLGIMTVLPGFAGEVPQAFKRIRPNANMTQLSSWMNFPKADCCLYIVDPNSPLFREVGKMFMEEQIAEFGTDHFYNCDPYNENTPISKDPAYLKNLAKSIYQSMADVDKSAIWVLQGWTFYNEDYFWGLEQAKAFLTGPPMGSVLVLDLFSEQKPQFRRLKSYFGQPFVWCMLHNFGGTLDLYGSLDILNEKVFEGRTFPNSSMVGIGLTPEGINQNYVIYEFMLEMGWRKNSTDVLKWIEYYITRRYGKYDESAMNAWKILRATVYNYKGGHVNHGQFVVNTSPSLGYKPGYWYQPWKMKLALSYLINAELGMINEGYLHDIVDVARQVCQVYIDTFYSMIIDDFKNKETDKFCFDLGYFLKLFDHMDIILKTNKAFLLGNWLNSAKAIAMNDNESAQYEYNARNQITIWGPSGQIRDYASKQWAGLVSHLFKPRWEMYVKGMKDSLFADIPFDHSKVSNEIWHKIERPFQTDRTNFTDVPSGDIFKAAKDLLKLLNPIPIYRYRSFQSSSTWGN